jgi:hypothetical protein
MFIVSETYAERIRPDSLIHKVEKVVEELIWTEYPKPCLLF